MLVGKPGLDGHSNGAEQIALRARDAGMDVVYDGIRLTPAQIAASALQEGVHVIGLSILSGSHRELIPAVIEALRERGVQAPVIVGGIIPEQDVADLREAGRRRRLHAEGLRHHAHHARDRGAPRRGSRAPGARRRQRARVSADGAALAARLREARPERGAGRAEPAREQRPGGPRAGGRAAGRARPGGRSAKRPRGT